MLTQLMHLRDVKPRILNSIFERQFESLGENTEE